MKCTFICARPRDVASMCVVSWASFPGCTLSSLSSSREILSWLLQLLSPLFLLVFCSYVCIRKNALFIFFSFWIFIRGDSTIYSSLTRLLFSNLYYFLDLSVSMCSCCFLIHCYLVSRCRIIPKLFPFHQSLRLFVLYLPFLLKNDTLKQSLCTASECAQLQLGQCGLYQFAAAPWLLACSVENPHLYFLPKCDDCLVPAGWGWTAVQEGRGEVSCLRAGQRCSQCSTCTGAAATGGGRAVLGCWDQGSVPCPCSWGAQWQGRKYHLSYCGASL